MENYKRYLNILKNMDLQDDESVNSALKRKGFYSKSEIYPISSIHFELTARCNACCKHCYNNSGNHGSGKEMTPEQWIEFSKYIVESGGVFECLLSGGEPLLFGDKLLDIMNILQDDGTIFYLMTNGYLLNEVMVDKLRKYQYHWLQISIDGANSNYHDWFRGLKGSWIKAVEGAKCVANKGIPLKIAHCVTPYNIEDIDEMCDLAYEIGAKSITIGGISLSGRTSKNMNLLLSHSEKQYLNEKIEKNRLRYKNVIRIKSTNSVKEGLKKHSKRPCSGVIIRPNGDIRIDGMAPFIIGNILEDDFTKIWKNKIDSCWNDRRVQEFINEFDENDINKSKINYVDDDIYL